MVTIYALTNLLNGKAYIGCTRGKIEKRLREHRCKLNAGTHSEPMLQSEWAVDGAKNFSMEVIYQLEEDASLHALRAMEKFAMQRYKASGLLYNMNEAAFEPTRKAQMNGLPKATATHGRRWTAEANLKRSLAQRGIPKGHGAKISATKQLKRLQAMR